MRLVYAKINSFKVESKLKVPYHELLLKALKEKIIDEDTYNEILDCEKLKASIINVDDFTNEEFFITSKKTDKTLAN